MSIVHFLNGRTIGMKINEKVTSPVIHRMEMEPYMEMV